MLKATDVNVQINNITSNLIEIGLCMDQNFPSIRSCNNRIKIVIPSSNECNIFLKNVLYKDMYYEMDKTRAFNLKMIDGALIQMQYMFYNDKLLKHRLGFFPSPNLEVFQNEYEMYLNDEIYSDITSLGIVTVPLRFDFDNSTDRNGCKVSIPVIHPVSHLTIGQYENCRIPVSSALTPYQFVEFILRNFYNTAYRKYSNQLREQIGKFEECIHDDEKKIINISIPR